MQAYLAGTCILLGFPLFEWITLFISQFWNTQTIDNQLILVVIWGNYKRNIYIEISSLKEQSRKPEHPLQM